MPAEGIYLAASLLNWVDSLHLRIEDAEATVRRACSKTPGGATPPEVVSFFLGAHGLSADHAPHVLELAAVMRHRGVLRRAPDGRYTAHYDDRPRVMALVQVPIGEWPAVARYTYRDASWVAGPEDRA